MLKRKHGQDSATIVEKMEKLGKSIGIRLYELVCLRERSKREQKPLEQMRFVHSQVGSVEGSSSGGHSLGSRETLWRR
jgi:Transport protein particle (TRAPP) component